MLVASLVAVAVAVAAAVAAAPWGLLQKWTRFGCLFCSYPGSVTCDGMENNNNLQSGWYDEACP
jgi:hypothetical protein